MKLALLTALLLAPAQLAQGQRPPYTPTPEERSALAARVEELGKRVAALHASGRDDALVADVEVYHKAAKWILRYPEEFYTRAYYDDAVKAVEGGIDRARALERGQSPWSTAKGRLIRAYRSRVDSSVQPYAVHVPEDYDPSKPVRLDLVLHGRGATLNEVSFIAQHERARPAPLKPGVIELHVFGRTNNAYRWSGETDVFEALDSVRSRYNIDPDRIVLRGFSMGGAGAWHIGLHHPDRWAAVVAGAGFTETLRYARQSDLPPHQLKPLRIYDAVEYTLNTFNVPIVGYGGEMDPQLRASLNIKERLAEEGLSLDSLRALFLVGPKTEHRWHPESLSAADEFVDRHIPRRTPDHIRFVTYTTRYNRCSWITIDALERHYERAEVEARRTADGFVIRTVNVARFSLTHPGGAVEVDGQNFAAGTSFEKTRGAWAAGTAPPRGKRHGLQGPIDDAFNDSFLVVTPTGKPRNQAAAALAAQRLDTFLRDYARWLRADPRVIEDRQLTSAQIRDHNLILFGDPSSNRVISRVAERLPIHWNGDSIRAGNRSYPSDRHLPVMIAPNPLNPDRYVVVNSGHTFGEPEFRGTNALLFPRLGDWAVLDLQGNPVAAGLFNERWQME